MVVALHENNGETFIFRGQFTYLCNKPVPERNESSSENACFTLLATEMNLNILYYISLCRVRIQSWWVQNQDKDLPYTAVAMSFQLI